MRRPPFGWAMLAALFTATAAASARGIVKNPGEHPHYAVELEPHLVLDWAGAPGPDDEGMGMGMRASIPLFHNGPLSKLNNNMAITFGLDWAYADRPCNRRDWWREDCSVQSYWLPVALQYNFFLTEMISVFGEPGLAIVHYRWDHWDRCLAPDYCDADASDTRFKAVMWGGARFMFSTRIGCTVRIGYPSLTAGVSFLL